MKRPPLLALLALAPFLARAADEPRTDWIDPDTGHRIIRLSTEPGSSTLYFHDNSYSPQGDKYMFTAPSGVMLVDLATLGKEPVKPQLIVDGGRGPYMARRAREVYFVKGGGGFGGRGANGGQPPSAQAQRDGSGGAPALSPTPQAGEFGARGGRGGRGGFGGGEVFAYNYDTKETRKVPNASRTLINCDETFTVATVTQEDPSGKTPKPPQREIVPQLGRMFPGKKMEELTPDERYAVQKEDGLSRRVFNPASMAFTFTNLKTGAAQTVGYQYGWLNHMQFSPTDPNLLLYCHEGTWHEVDRVWTIRTDGSEMTLRHKRTMDMEIAGHEFWSFDGRTIWFDLQTPRSQDFWIGGVNLDTGKETRYHLQRDWWGVHYNVSRDNKLFMSDGGDPTQVAFAKDGMWINLFRVQPDGTVAREKLVNMAKHNYVTGRGGVEPNGSITPDGKWVIFTGNFDGARHVYAVEVAKSK
ncbi:MAG TPA: oligogalacturonate lyase family protein [Opitutaceae bacterium]|nr:oligogalacturonate lyase family protein [Opitutaceae bacterium]